MTTARERARRRWFWPVDVPLTANWGESVEDYPLSAWEVEWLAAHGPLAPGETIPAEVRPARGLP